MVGDRSDPYVYEVALRLDDREPEIIALPVDGLIRRLEVGWAYGLAPGRHTLKLTLRNPRPGEWIRLSDLITYSERPAAPRY